MSIEQMTNYIEKTIFGKGLPLIYNASQGLLVMKAKKVKGILPAILANKSTDNIIIQISKTKNKDYFLASYSSASAFQPLFVQIWREEKFPDD